MKARWAAIGVVLGLVWGLPARALPPMPAEPTDAYLLGVLSTLLERELGWARGSYGLQVQHGVARVTLAADDPRRQGLAQALPAVEGLQGLHLVLPETVAEPESSLRKEVYSFLGLTPDTVPFPVGDLFAPLLADPKQPEFFTSVRYYSTPTLGARAAAVGYGETFGFYRRQGRRAGDGLQVSMSGGLFAQFNFDSPSFDLINADYTMGLPISWRNGPDSLRLRIYHQSSHLGDEYLLRARPQRLNLSFESAELLLSHEQRRWRYYFGGEYLFHREPADLAPSGVHGGVEYRGRQPVLGLGHWVGGVDLKSWQEHGWALDSSVKAGLEFGAAQPGQRRVRLMFEGYTGYAPHGQFYEDKIHYYGIGLYLGF